MEEYFHQSDKEKRDALPVAPFMDRSELQPFLVLALFCLDTFDMYVLYISHYKSHFMSVHGITLNFETH